jgi:hypothetical protein
LAVLLPRQNAHDLEREIWRAAHQKQKLLLANGDELHVGGRDRGGAARRGVDQRHLAENVVVGQHAEQPVAEPDVDVTALDDKEFRRRIAFLENDLTSLEFAQRSAGTGRSSKASRRLQRFR